MKLTDKIRPWLESLRNPRACSEAVEWVGDRTFQEAWAECPRGDWMLWLYQRMYPENKREIIGTAGRCANTVRHLMKYEESRNCVDTCVAYGEGNATDEELKKAWNDNADADAADDAYETRSVKHAYWAAFFAADASSDVYFSAYEASAASAADAADAADDAAEYSDNAAAYAAAAAAREKKLLETAEICRKYLILEEK